MIFENDTWERTQAELNLASVREDAEQIEKAGAAFHAWLIAKPRDKPEALKRALRRDFADGRADMDRLAHYKSLAASNGYLEDYGHDAVDRAWLEAQKWHEAHPLAGSWKAEDDEGKERVFISEEVTGLEAALEALGIDLRYNVRAAVTELRRDNGPWEEWNDRVEADLRDMIAALYAFSRKNSKGFRAQRAWWSNANFKVVLDGLLKQREVDPFVEWLDRPRRLGRRAATLDLAGRTLRREGQRSAPCEVGGPHHPDGPNRSGMEARAETRRNASPERRAGYRQEHRPQLAIPHRIPCFMVQR